MWFAEFDYSEKLFRQNKDPVEAFRIALLAALNMLYNHYDVVLLDCPPGFSVSTRAGILIADAIVSPTLADEISLLSLADFTQLGIREILSERATDRHYVVVSRFDASLVEQRRMLRILERSYDVLKPPTKPLPAGAGRFV
jgi:cellulose biosynthesis protein BcsQ